MQERTSSSSNVERYLSNDNLLSNEAKSSSKKAHRNKHPGSIWRHDGILKNYFKTYFKTYRIVFTEPSLEPFNDSERSR